MKSRTWTIDDGQGDDLRCYKGFAPLLVNDPQLPLVAFIAVVTSEDVVYTYALDDLGSAKSELERYIRDESEIFGIPFKLMGIYERK